MKPFCIYFPQFHPLSHNNKTWGYGFTDWMLVSYANMHHLWQRRAPAIGFYDGASEAVHLEQISQMKAGGLGGAALYHYWFYDDEKVLDSFEQTLLKHDGAQTLPWFLVWATESWSKRWLGDHSEIIRLTNQPTEMDIEKHCRYLCECFKSENYLKINGKPVFIFFNLSHFLDPKAVVASYRKHFEEMGATPLLGQFVKNPFDSEYSDFLDINYLFEPRLFFGFQNKLRSGLSKSIFDLLRKLMGENFSKRLLVFSDRFKKYQQTYSAKSFVDYMKSEHRQAFKSKFKSSVNDVLSPGWNNVPRHGVRYTAIENIASEDFKAILNGSMGSNSDYPTLINAWNEWSEGAAIEPCHYLGTKYLDVVKSLDV